MMRGLSSLQQLEALSQTRPLTDDEAMRLYKALNHRQRKNERWYWSRADDYRLVRHLLRGRKPKLIAVLMKRSELSIWTRMRRLGLNARKFGSGAAKSPIASTGGKGE